MTSQWFDCEADSDDEAFLDDLDETARRVDTWFAEFDEVWSTDPELVAHPTMIDAFTMASWWWVSARGNVLDLRAAFNEHRTDEHEVRVTFIGRTPDLDTRDPDPAVVLAHRCSGPHSISASVIDEMRLDIPEL